MVALQLPEICFGLLLLQAQAIAVEACEDLTAADIVAFLGEKFSHLSAYLGDNGGIGKSFNRCRTGVNGINVTTSW